jgi:hypothetical protein
MIHVEKMMKPNARSLYDLRTNKTQKKVTFMLMSWAERYYVASTYACMISHKVLRNLNPTKLYKDCHGNVENNTIRYDTENEKLFCN